ncbi:MAG TPA: delta-60 repeat domain-containing protein, partial [Candidatus Kapabacteria bacterium]
MKRITILLLVFFSSQLARAQAGYLDETFGKYGFVFAETSGFSEYALSVAVMPDGKIFQCSSATNENGSYGRLILRRYNPNGSIDSSFADNGAYISNDITSFVSAKIFPYSDGRTLVVGQIASGYISNGKIQYSPFILRLLSNGNVDTSFGKNGVISEYHHGVSEEYCSARIENDGIIVIIGARGDTGKMLPVVTKLNSNGEKLSSFGDEGTVSVYSSTEPIFIADADINSSGDCVFAGSYGPEGFKNTIIIRSNIHGELVPSFGNNGVVRVANFDTDEEV